MPLERMLNRRLHDVGRRGAAEHAHVEAREPLGGELAQFPERRPRR